MAVARTVVKILWCHPLTEKNKIRTVLDAVVSTFDYLAPSLREREERKKKGRD